MISREHSIALLYKYIEGNSLIHHSKMVARAMEAYAIKLNKNEEDIELWWTTGLLHDLDWEKYPDEHPNKAVNEILPQEGYPKTMLHAIQAHAPLRTGVEPTTELDCYLFACDELSGFIHAVSLVRPNAYEGMKVKSVTKKLKTLKFAENVPREDIKKGAELINENLNDHIKFLIDVFKS